MDREGSDADACLVVGTANTCGYERTRTIFFIFISCLRGAQSSIVLTYWNWRLKPLLFLQGTIESLETNCMVITLLCLCASIACYSVEGKNFSHTDGETVSCLPSICISISKRRGFDSRSVYVFLSSRIDLLKHFPYSALLFFITRR